MKSSASAISFALLMHGIALEAACASPSVTREIQPVTMNPASADAQDFPDGQVPF